MCAIPDCSRGAIYPVQFTSDFADRLTLAALEAVAHREQPIVTYSSGARCARACRASVLAVDWGFRRVHYSRGGIFDWRDVQFPIESLR